MDIKGAIGVVGKVEEVPNRGNSGHNKGNGTSSGRMRHKFTASAPWDKAKQALPASARACETFRSVSYNDTLDVLRRPGETHRSGGRGMPKVGVEDRFASW